MTDDARRLLQAALRLPALERAALVAELAASLDDADLELIEELERRADAAAAGTSRSATWDEVDARIESSLRDGV